MNNLNTICGARSSIASQPAVNKLDSINRNPDISPDPNQLLSAAGLKSLIISVSKLSNTLHRMK